MAAELILVGVGHVFDIGNKIEEIIEKEMPDGIALELDVGRALALQSSEKRRKYPNFLYSLLAKLQDNIAKKFGNAAGSEMLAAINKAKELGIPVFYIDINAEEIIKQLWQNLSLRKKISILFSIFLSLFMRKEKIEKEVEKFQEDVDYFMKKMEENFPEIKEVVIDKRNLHMAKRLGEILKEKGKVIAIVGEGHIEGLKNLLGKEEIELRIIHLKNIM
ncbi:MAG: hypothetical protein DRN29_01960 [Thermoplasmata archaeon]|nr:MAG: hypothetical protein DRN29_01960 [Thermoplasmata archaeon]